DALRSRCVSGANRHAIDLSVRGHRPQSGLRVDATQAPGDRRRGLADLPRKLGDSLGRDAEGGSADFDGANDRTPRVENRSRQLIHARLELADGGHIIPAPNTRQLFEERLEPDQGPLRVRDQARAHDAQNVPLGHCGKENLARSNTVQRGCAAGPVTHCDEIRPSAWATVNAWSPSRMARLA